MVMNGSAPEFDEQRFEALYDEHFGLLVGIAVQKFRVPETDAETLAHEVFLSYLKNPASVRELRSWLVGAICHASRYYWRTNARLLPEDAIEELERIDPATVNILDSLPNQLAAREALSALSPRYQEILRLRFFEGLTVPELAQRLGVKKKYAAKLLSKCLRRAETLYVRKGRRMLRRR
jgi:RNA polymerase sigma-70 factor (ECF subfamily)